MPAISLITQKPAVKRNNRSIEYVNQLWNWYLLLIVSLSMFDLNSHRKKTKEKKSIRLKKIFKLQQMNINLNQYKVTYNDFANKTEQDPIAPDTIA